MRYEEYLEEVRALVKEPLPEHPSEAVATFAETWFDTKSAQQKPIDGIPLPGYENFNRLTRGIRPHEFTILCGPTGCGKTTLLANLACTLTTGSTPIFIGSVETGKTDFMRVMAGIFANKDPYGAWSQEEVTQVEKDYAQVLQSHRHIFCRYDSRVPHENLLADLLYAHETMGTKIALIDNLNFLMDVAPSRDQIAVMDQAVHDFVVFVKKVPIHVVMVMHPKKTDNGRVHSEFDIKGSSTAVQEAANVILWNRLEDESHAPEGYFPEWCREMKFCKVRKNGRAVGSRIVFSIDRKSPRLKEERLL